MKYAIHQRCFQYNDEFFGITQGRKLDSIYSDKTDAFNTWINLERESLVNIPLSSREPMQLYWIDDGKYYQQSIENWQYIFDKLKNFGINVGFGDKHSLPNDEDLQIDKLPDEQLADILLHTNCNEYVLQGYEADDKKYVLYFANNGLNKYFSGYLKADEENFWQDIMEKDSPEQLFEAGILGYLSEDDPIASFFSEKDANNPLVQSILQQYGNSFKVVGNMISFFDEENYQSLQAMNAVLEHPFYEIQAVTPEALLELQQKEAEKDDMPQPQPVAVSPEQPQPVIREEIAPAIAPTTPIQPKGSFLTIIKNWFK